ncbi:MAG: hypothetical protein KatS3mg115_0072 [Candidatus Poribacteria bacterium]|nr:MAG: hypothetical protein KatS3mg115_0072 [Candidatus Poribacteria bacterium]
MDGPAGAHSGALDRWFGGPSAWFADRKRAGGGGLFDLGCHQMDILPWLMGGDPRRVTAIINNFSNAYPIDDNSATLIEFDSKAIGVVDVSWVHRSGFNMVELYGTEGSIAWGHGGFHFQTRKLDDAGRERYLQQRPAGLPSPFEQWVNAILDGAPTTITIQDGRNLTELLQAAYRSAESGQAVVLPLES